MVSDDERIVAARDKAAGRTLAWIEKNVVETRMQDRTTGTMIRARNQKMVVATFRHDTSRRMQRPGRSHICPNGRRCSATPICCQRRSGAVTAEAAERTVAGLERQGELHAARGLDYERHWTTDAAIARESETIALMRAGQDTGKTVMRCWIAETRLHWGHLTEGQKEAIKIAPASKDRVAVPRAMPGPTRRRCWSGFGCLQGAGD